MPGTLQKLQANLRLPVEYALPIGNTIIPLNPLLGQRIQLTYTGRILCVHCQTPTKKSFNQGYCYRCFIQLAQCDLCIVKPETCHFAKGTCREPDWAQQFCFQPHVVYLANSSGIKVGITRHNQIPTRWLDQGAIQALPVFQAKSRHISGLLEVILAQHVADKTNWQKMLKHQVEVMDLLAQRDNLLQICELELDNIKNQFGDNAFQYLAEGRVVSIDYPVSQYPSKIKSFNLDSQPRVEGILQGIKGQYLLLDTGVINIRKFTGYEVDFGG
jgi:Protein of unknown function (DUF2797)